MDFFEKSVGNWKSFRNYYYLNDGGLLTSKDLITDIEVNKVEVSTLDVFEMEDLNGLKYGTLTDVYSIHWISKEKDDESKEISIGEMIISPYNGKLLRNKGYFTKNAVVSEILDLTDSRLVIESQYGGKLFRERIEFINNKYRTRQTYGFKGTKTFLVGQYLEIRQ